MSNLDSAKSGNRLDALRSLRDTLAEVLDTTEAQIHAQLAAQYRSTLSDIAELEEIEQRDEGEPDGDGDEGADEAWQPG